MADSVLLAGAGARIEFNPGTANIDFGPITMACVVKHAPTTWQTLMFGSGPSYRLFVSDLDRMSASDGANEYYDGPFAAGNVWNLYALTKASGSVAPRYHYYNGTSWDHQPGGTVLTDASAATEQWISESGGDVLQGSILIAGWANTAFSDGQIEALDDGYAAWIAAGFLEGIRFNATAGLSTFTAGSMTQQTQVGISLDTGDVPSWWNDALGGPTQNFLPDGDLDVAGWVTSPLYSKVNDASDATLVTDGLV